LLLSSLLSLFCTCGLALEENTGAVSLSGR